MSFLLELTSPYMTGDHCKEAQYLLHKNRFGQDFRPGTIDGVYGPHTAGAAHRAKYWLGYARGDINGACGEHLISYLMPLNHAQARRLPLDYNARRKIRLRQAAEVSWREKVVAFAKTQVGYTEFGPNETKYNEWYYGFNNPAPWCCIFVSYCISLHSTRRFHQAFVPYVVDMGRRGLNGMHFVTYSEAVQGDLVCYDWQGDGIADHVEFLDKKLSSSELEAVGGNTGTNENAVALGTRTLNLVQHIIRIP